MWPWSRRTIETSENGTATPRAERVQGVLVSCELGPIVDISKSGMRVRVEGTKGLAAGAALELELSGPTDSMVVRARVVRVRGLGGGRHEAALVFEGLSDAEAQSVENLARWGKRRGVGAGVSPERRERLIEALRMPDYYKLLEVASGASSDEIHRAFRGLARRYHPDVCREPDAQQRFCQISEAYGVLAEPGRRTEYDALYAMRNAA